MSTPEPAAMRQRILEEAARLFVTRGYTGISMREIAEAVGVSKAGLYYHFKDKEDLLLAILTGHLAGIERVIREARSAGGTAREQVDRMMRGIFVQSPDQRALIRFASQEMVHISPEARARFGNVYHEQFLDPLKAILQEGIGRGELRPVDTHQAVWILLGMAYPFFYPGNQSEMGNVEQAIDLMLQIFFDGLSNS